MLLVCTLFMVHFGLFSNDICHFAFFAATLFVRVVLITSSFLFHQVFMLTQMRLDLCFLYIYYNKYGLRLYWFLLFIHDYSYVSPELPNSAAQQPRQTQQKEIYQ
jgi:hypothetical protein